MLGNVRWLYVNNVLEPAPDFLQGPVFVRLRGFTPRAFTFHRTAQPHLTAHQEHIPCLTIAWGKMKPYARLYTRETRASNLPRWLLGAMKHQCQRVARAEAARERRIKVCDGGKPGTALFTRMVFANRVAAKLHVWSDGMRPYYCLICGVTEDGDRIIA